MDFTFHNTVEVKSVIELVKVVIQDSMLHINREIKQSNTTKAFIYNYEFDNIIREVKVIVNNKLEIVKLIRVFLIIINTYL